MAGYTTILALSSVSAREKIVIDTQKPERQSRHHHCVEHFSVRISKAGNVSKKVIITV